MNEPLVIGRPPRSSAVSLLQAHGLPVSDLTDELLEHFFFVGSRESPTALVGLEVYGPDALLRSLIVCENARSRGLGSTLVEHAEHYAAAKGVRSIYLLTTSAELFFRCLAYERIERSRAPLAIQRTREFADLCPASSVFMVKSLEPSG